MLWPPSTLMQAPVVNDASSLYRLPATLAANQWGLEGQWMVSEEAARLDAPGGRIVYQFRGRDLHLVMAPRFGGKPVRFQILIDGKAPGADHGVDLDANGNGIVTEQRLYQLVRQSDGNAERRFEIIFLDPGVQAYAFTFG